MKFENTNYKIKINKYRVDDLKLTPKGIYMIGKDTSAASLRLPALQYKKHFIIPAQIAYTTDYVYIPEDKVPEDDMIYSWPKPVDSKIMEKYKWLAIKNKYKY